MQRVILCLVRPDDNEVTQVTTEVLIDLFRRFGRLNDVRIFERRVMIKAFVEFENHKDAQMTLDKVHTIQTFFSHRLKVYQSTKKRIMRTNSRPFTEDLSKEWPPQTASTNCDTQQPFLSYTTTSHTNHLQQPSDGTLPKIPNVDALFASSVQSSLARPPLPLQNRKVTSTHEIGPPILPQQLLPPFLFRVLMVNRLTSSEINYYHLAALYSCYGQVIKILINSTLDYALIEFSSHDEAIIAASCLKTVRLFGCLLKTKVSKYQSLHFRSLEKNTSDVLRHYTLPPSMWRSKAVMFSEPPTPRATLAVHNCPPSLSPQLLHLLVTQVHEPLRVTLHPHSHPPLFLVELPSLDQAVDVLASLDRLRVDDLVIIVTFAPESLSFPSSSSSPAG